MCPLLRRYAYRLLEATATPLGIIICLNGLTADDNNVVMLRRGAAYGRYAVVYNDNDAY